MRQLGNVWKTACKLNPGRGFHSNGATGDEVAPKVHFLGHYGVASLIGLKAGSGESGR